MSAGLLTGETLGHYRIIERLAAGAMGEVYRAEDLRLRRDVALKTIRPEDDPEDGTARLVAEARAASALNHPHIAVVYEIGHAIRGTDSLAYIAMEYVEGRTLAALAREGPLDLDVVLDIFEQIADALAEAERGGIVHRDLKPGNVMIAPSGRVKVLDFGVALRQRAAPAGADDPTRTADRIELGSGFAGTVGYAAPEQMAGRDVDVRADLFAFGVMLYELVCGRRPFDGDNPAQVLEAMLTREVPPFPDPQRDPRLPVLERFVRRLLAREPADRPASAAGLRATLESIRVAVRPPQTPHGDAPPVVAVAGFVNISGNADDEWLAAGLAETLTMDAAQLESVTVLSRERVREILRTLRQQTGEPEERLYVRAARALGARWVVAGGFQRSGAAVRVTASLTDVVSGEIVRTARVDGNVDGIFELQDRLVRELAGSLRAAMSPAAPLPDTEVVSAYEAFSLGVLNRQAESFEALDRAVLLFERAIALDPAYARAHVELGAALGAKADYLSMPELNARALVSLRRSLELQPGSARAWRELGSALVLVGDNAGATAALRRALEIHPDDASSLGTMGRVLFIGYARFPEAAEWFDRALEQNPNAGWYSLQLAHCAALLREFERGERAAARSMELQETFLSGRQGLFIAGGYMRAGHLAALQGRHADAVNFFRREIDFLVRTEHPLRHRILVELNARLGASYQRLGDSHRANHLFDVALESFERRIRLGADDPFTRYYAAAVHALRGDAEPALAFLERALARMPAFTAARAAIEPEFASLREDPRFQRLVPR
ncbi:MAG TPA: protein kinase [Vicinamibacterales bacterium]|nr:protein kinase [Vicinamibacterales bacterium]